MAKIELHPDFKDFLRLLNSHDVRYMLVGGLIACVWGGRFLFLLSNPWRFCAFARDLYSCCSSILSVLASQPHLWNLRNLWILFSHALRSALCTVRLYLLSARRHQSSGPFAPFSCCSSTLGVFAPLREIFILLALTLSVLASLRETSFLLSLKPFASLRLCVRSLLLALNLSVLASLREILSFDFPPH